MRFGFRDVHEKVNEGREYLPYTSVLCTSAANLPNKVSLPKESDRLPDQITLKRDKED